MKIQNFELITQDSHPAAQAVYAFLESLAHKDMVAFASNFGKNSKIFANLPGGVKVRSKEQLIEMHDDFFNSSVSRFEYGPLVDAVGSSEFFTCSVPVKVILPNGTKRQVNIDITFYKNSESHPSWIPGRLVNTVEDLSQAVLRPSNL